MPQILSLPLAVPLSTAGGLLAGAKLYATATHSSTPIDTFADYALTIPNSNPVEADGNGVFPIIFLTDAVLYRIEVTTAAGVTLPGYPIDDIGTVSASSIGAATLAGDNTLTGTNTISGMEPRLIIDETDGGTDKRLWDVDVQAGVLKIRTRTDADGTGKDILTVTRGTGTAISGIDIGNATDLPAITLNGDPLVTSVVGTFTGTLTGCTSSPTASFNYSKVGNIAYIACSAGLTGTSNSTDMTITGMTASLTPTADRTCRCYVTDNGSTKAASCTVSGTTLTFILEQVVGAIIVPAATLFTGSGTKGVNANVLSISFQIT